MCACCFFKQKTAYEMRISDWSSDVCSSDLHILSAVPVGTDQMVRDYYMNELGVINRFIRQHAFGYEYYLADETAKDANFFLCRNKSTFSPGQEHQPEDRKSVG